MRTYSLDLQVRVVAAVERGDSTIEEAAAAFGLGQTFVKKMLRQKRETGDLSPLPHGGGHTPLLSAKHLAALRAEVIRHPDKSVGALSRLHRGAGKAKRQRADRLAGASQTRPAAQKKRGGE